MKKMLKLKLLFAFIYLLSSLLIAENSKKVPTGTMAIQSAQSVYQNGDKVQISGEGFPAFGEIKVVVLSVQKTDDNLDYYILKNSDLKINKAGKLSGYVVLEGLKENDKWGEILISVKGANVEPTNRFDVAGDLPSAPPSAIRSNNDFEFTDHNGNGYAQLNEQLDITKGGSGWGTVTDVLACWRQEYNGTTFIKQFAIDQNNLTFDVNTDTLQGYTNNGSQAYDSQTDRIQLRILDDTFVYSTSGNTVPTSAPAIPNHFEVTLQVGGSTVPAGTAFTIVVTAKDGGGATVTGYTGAHTLHWRSNATASPNGTAPILAADGEQTFSSGEATVSGFTLFNAGETPYIRATDLDINAPDSITTTGGVLTVIHGTARGEVRIKTVDESANGSYDSNLLSGATFQGPTQANPDKSTGTLYGITYDGYGNFYSSSDAGDWNVTGSLTGGFSSVFPSDVNTYTFNDQTGDTTSGTITYDIGGSVPVGQTGKIFVDDFAPATVTGFAVSTDNDDSRFVYANWNGSSSGDDGTSGTPTDYEIVWRDAAFGPIDTEGEWNLATSLGSGPAFDSPPWHIDMSGFPAGDKYFAMRTYDDVGNISDLGLGSYTSGTPDYSLPVELVSFTCKGDYNKVVLEWETASEVNNEGFFVYRSSKTDGVYQAVNSDIIAGNGNTNTAHTYRYEDESVVAGETYFYKLYSRDFNGILTAYSSTVSATVLEMPNTFSIDQNYPNPFNPTTRFRFSIAEASRASLAIYNILGQKIRTIFDNRVFEPGVYEGFAWDATDDSGNPVANGVYYYEFKVPAQNIRQVKKMLYLK